jgi:hypothetical protein
MKDISVRCTFFLMFDFLLATDDFKGTNYSGILPMAGAEIRFKAIPKRRINIGFDAAIGKDDWGVYFRIGETFTK